MAANPGQMRFDCVAPSTIKHDAPQVRRDWRHDDGYEKLKGLEQSIRRHGILQPLLVRELPYGQRNGYLYEVIAGHGRLVCALRIPLKEVPILIGDADDRRKALLQLSENMHRRHLVAIDEALAMQALIRSEGWTQKQMADELGVTATLVSQRLLLLRNDVLRDAQERGLLAASVATALRQLPDDEHSKLLYERLERGEKLKMPDVQAARLAQQTRQGPQASARQLGLREPETEERIRRAIALREAGRNQFEIAQELGLSQQQVSTYLRGHALAAEGQVAETAGMSREELRREVQRLRTGGASLDAISSALGLGRPTVDELLATPATPAPSPQLPQPVSAPNREGADVPPTASRALPPTASSAPPGASLIERLPEEQAEALAEAIGPAIEARLEDSGTASQPFAPQARPQTEAQYGRDPQDVVVERPAPKSAVYREPTLEELFAPVRSGPCWLPMGRILHKAAKDGLSAAALYEAYRAAGGSG